MKIAVFSDSHKRVDILEEAIKHVEENKADLILHAGDLVKVEALEALAKSKIEYIAVFGNNDEALKEYKNSFNIYEEVFYFTKKNLSKGKKKFLNFKLMHKAKNLENDADIIIFGHSHNFLAFLDKGSLYLNPGELCGRDKGIFEFAYIDIEDDLYKVKRLYKRKEEEAWQEEEFLLKSSS